MDRPKSTTYLMDGVYAEHDGYAVTLLANGIGVEATDRIYLDPETLGRLNRWLRDGSPDHWTELSHNTIPAEITALKDQIKNLDTSIHFLTERVNWLEEKQADA